VFDFVKLDWLNGKYLRELSPQAFVERVLEWGGEPERFAAMASLAQARVERLQRSRTVCSRSFLPAVSTSPKRNCSRDRSSTKTRCGRALALAMWDLDASQTFDKATVEAVLGSVAERLSRKFRDIARVFYVALTAARRPCRSTTPWCCSVATSFASGCAPPERARAPTAAEQKAWRA